MQKSVLFNAMSVENYGLRVFVLEIGPEEAIEILGEAESAGFENRKIRKRHVGKIASEMLDRWMMNGETLVFDTDGILMDGYHRMYGIIESGAKVSFLCVMGVDRACYSTIDDGTKRTLGDQIKSKVQTSNYNAVAAAVRLYALYKDEPEGPVSVMNWGAFSNSRGVEMLLKHPDIEAYVEAAANEGPLVPSGTAGFCWKVFAEIDDDLAREFFHRVLTGESLKIGSPEYILREKLLANESRPKHGDRLSRNAIVYFLFKAFAAKLHGREIRMLKVPQGSMNFPRLAR